MPPVTPSATFICLSLRPIGLAFASAHESFFFFRFRFLRRIAVAIRYAELHKSLQNLLLRDLRRLMTRLFEHRRAAALDLARTQRGENHKAIFTVDIVGNGNQARPPNEAMISSMRPCCRRGTAVPLTMMDSRRLMDFSRTSLMTM